MFQPAELATLEQAFDDKAGRYAQDPDTWARDSYDYDDNHNDSHGY